MGKRLFYVSLTLRWSCKHVISCIMWCLIYLKMGVCSFSEGGSFFHNSWLSTYGMGKPPYTMRTTDGPGYSHRKYRKSQIKNQKEYATPGSNWGKDMGVIIFTFFWQFVLQLGLCNNAGQWSTVCLPNIVSAGSWVLAKLHELQAGGL